MNTKTLFLLGCGLALHAGAQAQAPGPADPSAAVPPTVYRSALTPPHPEALAAPGDWRRLNADVGQFENGHMDIIKWEARNAAGARTPVPAPASPSAPAPATGAPSPTGHQHGHGMHHGHGAHGGHGMHDGRKPGSKP